MGTCISIHLPKPTIKEDRQPMAQSDSLGSSKMSPEDRRMLDEVMANRTYGNERQKEAFRRFLARGEPGETPYPK